MDDIGTFILIIIAIIISIWAIVAWAGMLMIAVAASAALGWIPILMCANSVDTSIGVGFVGKWALLSIWVYLVISIGLTVLLWVKPDPDGLPPAWKFLTMFYSVRENYRVSASNFDPSNFTESVAQRPSTLYGTRMMDRVFQKANTRMKERERRLEDETESYLRTAKERAEYAENLLRATARNKAAREWTEKNSDKES